MSRRFPTAVMAAAWRRAAGHCEACTAPIGRGRINYDHVIAYAMGGPSTLANCEVLCLPCHGAKTAKTDVPAIAKVKRKEAVHIGAKRSRGGWPCGKDTPYKKTVDGRVVRR